MSLDDLLRQCLHNDADSLLQIAKKSGVAQATLQEFLKGRASDGKLADLRLSSAQKLIDYYGVKLVVPSKETKKKGSWRAMNLNDELELYGFFGGPERFRTLLLETLEEVFPGSTIDSILCQPSNALDYCKVVRKAIAAPRLLDAVILKALVNLRKVKRCPKGLGGRITRRNLRKELQMCGCDLEPHEFRTLVADCFADMYKSRTVDELLSYPPEAEGLCLYVRGQAGCRQLPFDLILATLMNNRKSVGIR